MRLVYLHPPIAWVALYLAFGLAALSSLLYLWRRTRSLFWDRLAAASVEVGRRLQRAHARHRHALGAADLGGLVDLGRPTDLDRAAPRAVPRLPGVAPGAGRPRGAGEALRRGRADRVRRRPDRALLGRVVADAAPGCDGPECGPLADHPRVDGVDAAARVRRARPSCSCGWWPCATGSRCWPTAPVRSISRSRWPSDGPRVGWPSRPHRLRRTARWSSGRRARWANELRRRRLRGGAVGAVPLRDRPRPAPPQPRAEGRPGPARRSRPAATEATPGES